MLHPIAGGSDHHDAETETREVLLKLDSLVRREEDRESVSGGAAKERTVLEAAPALLLDGPALVAGELAGELTR